MGIKFAVNEKFFEKWTEEMSYVLGYISADGNLNNSPRIRAQYLSVVSIDKDRMTEIKRLMSSEHKIVKTISNLPNRRPIYLLRIGSHKIFKSLEKLGLTPKKSLTLKFPAIPNEFLPHFIRGYFDGDGCVYIEKTIGKSNNQIIKRLNVTFTSGSPLFLEKMSTLLEKNIGLSKRKVYKSHRSFQLRYSTLDSVKIFPYLYSKRMKQTYLKRKYTIFLEYFKLRPGQINETIKQIITAT